MKYAAILLTLVFLAGLSCAGYLWLTCDVTAEATGVEAVEASAQPELFESLRAMDPETINGTVADYVFYTWVFRLSNTTFIPAEQVEARIVLQAGDACQVPDETNRVLPARSEGDLRVTVLTRTNSTPVRDAVVSWYLWGQPYTASLIAR